MTKTTREIERETNGNIALFSILMSVLLSLLIMPFLFNIHEKVYHKPTCDIGLESIAGDYKSTFEDFTSIRQCAVEDCVAFNKIHESIDGYDGVRCEPIHERINKSLIGIPCSENKLIDGVMYYCNYDRKQSQ